MDNVTRGRKAANALKDPVLLEAFEVVKQAYTDKMINTLPEDTATRDQYHRCIHALADVKTTLTLFVNTGKIQEVKIEQKEKAKK